jgi:hypothetical protein
LEGYCQSTGDFMQNIFLSRALFAWLLIAVVSLQSYDARGEGALALGIPKSVASDGFAFGYSIKKDTPSSAREDALRRCQNTEEGSKAARALCRIVETFSGKCLAIAMDPKAGTPGIGWSIDDDILSAEARAMSQCRATAGADREGFCKVDKSACDGD